MRQQNLVLAWALVVSLGTSAAAHQCGPPTLSMFEGDPPLAWRITADLTETETVYTPLATGDPAIATLSPAGPFAAHHGDFSVTPHGPGTTTLAVEWFYAPTEAGGVCTVQVTVQARCSVDITAPARATVGTQVELAAVLSGGSGSPPSYQWTIASGAGTIVSAEGANAIVTAAEPGSVEVQVALTGGGCQAGAAATHVVVFDPGRPEVGASPPCIEFGTIRAPGSSAPLPLVLYNAGDLNLVIEGLDFTPAAGSPFKFPPGGWPILPFTLPPGNGFPLEILYEPEAAGSHQGNLVIQSNDAAQPTFVVPLLGTGETGGDPTAPLSIEGVTGSFRIDALLGQEVCFLCEVRVKNNGIALAEDLSLNLFTTSPALTGLEDTDGDSWADAIETGINSSCRIQTSQPESYLVEGSCEDGLDNDQDGAIDQSDLDCVGERYGGCVPMGEGLAPTPESCEDMRRVVGLARDGLPLGQGGGEAEPRKPKLQISLGDGSGYPDFKPLTDSAKAAGFDVEETDSSAAEIEQQVKALGRGDIWVFLGHGSGTPNLDLPGTEPSRGTGIFGNGTFSGADPVPTRNLRDWMGSDEDPPGIVLLLACDTGRPDDPAEPEKAGIVIRTLKDAQVPLVIAPNGKASHLNFKSAGEALLQALFAGKTLQEAIEAGKAHLPHYPGAARDFNIGGKLVCDLGELNVRGMTLAQIQAAAKGGGGQAPPGGGGGLPGPSELRAASHAYWSFFLQSTERNEWMSRSLDQDLGHTVTLTVELPDIAPGEEVLVPAMLAIEALRPGLHEHRVLANLSHRGSKSASRVPVTTLEVGSEDCNGLDDDGDGLRDEGCAPAGELYRRGDSNSSGALDISDAVHTFGFLFLGLAAGTCLDAADANDDGRVDVSDGIFSLGFLFLNGAPPPPPGHVTCGLDATADGLPACDSGTTCPS